MVGPLDLCWGNLPQLEHTDKYCHSSTQISSMYVPQLQRCQNNIDSEMDGQRMVSRLHTNHKYKGMMKIWIIFQIFEEDGLTSDHLHFYIIT